MSRDHSDKIHEWNVSNFLTKQILKDEEKLCELRKKYFEKKQLYLSDEQCPMACKETVSYSVASKTTGTLKSTVEVGAVLEHNNTFNKRVKSQLEVSKSQALKITCNKPKKKVNLFNDDKLLKSEQQRKKNVDSCTEHNEHKKQKLFYTRALSNAQTLPQPQTYYKNIVVMPTNNKDQDQEMVDNIFFEKLIEDHILDPINGNEYHGGDDDHSINSVNYIQETFQNSFDKIQEKLDAELEIDNEQLKWEDTLKSDDSNDEMSGKLLGIDESVMLI